MKRCSPRGGSPLIHSPPWRCMPDIYRNAVRITLHGVPKNGERPCGFNTAEVALLARPGSDCLLMKTLRARTGYGDANGAYQLSESPSVPVGTIARHRSAAFRPGVTFRSQDRLRQPRDARKAAVCVNETGTCMNSYSQPAEAAGRTNAMRPEVFPWPICNHAVSPPAKHHGCWVPQPWRRR